MSNPIDPINPKINSHNMLLNATRGYTYTIISIYIYTYIYIYIYISNQTNHKTGGEIPCANSLGWDQQETRCKQKWGPRMPKRHPTHRKWPSVDLQSQDITSHLKKVMSRPNVWDIAGLFIFIRP